MPDDPRNPESEPGEEPYVLEFTRILDEGFEPDAEEYLRRVPEPWRERCRARIGELLSMRRALDEAAEEAPARPAAEGPPRIPGFRVDQRIGEGALGVVYAAFDETLRRDVAIKVLREETGAEVRARVVDEAQKAAAFSHPAVVTVHSVAQAGDRPAIVMERVEGFPLDRAVAELPFRQRARILATVARALAAAHARGLIHRDLKPDNILVSPALEPKILDFGLAIDSGRAGEEQPGVFRGTPAYASPEQLRGERLTPASDVFSFGCVMFHALTGRPPYEAKSVSELFRKILETDPPFPRSLSSKVPLDLQAICLACLARDPEERPGAQEVAADLGRHLTGEPARLRPALFRDTLRRDASAGLERARSWSAQGLIPPDEGDGLLAVYRRVLEEDDPWVLDARRLSLPQTVVYAATWVVVLGAAFLVWYAREPFAPAARVAIPGGCFAILFGLGLFAHLRREAVASAAFLAGAILALFPAILSALPEIPWLADATADRTRLLPSRVYTNRQILAASGGALALSILCLAFLRRTAFAWTSAALAIATYAAWRIAEGLLDLRPEAAAAWLLPLSLLTVAGILFEARERPRFALPFHLAGLLGFVLPLDWLAAEGGTWKLFGDGDFLEGRRERYLSFTLNGLLFLAATVLFERSRSLDLRRGARLLQALVPLHLLGSLYLSAERHGTWGDIGAYLGAVLLLLLLAPWRNRRWLLSGGLLGVALGLQLPLGLELVPAPAYTLSIAAGGVSLALLSYLYLRRGSRGPS